MKKLTICPALILAAACGGDPETSATPYQPGDITIVGSNLGSESKQRDQCGKECATLDDECGDDAAADVVLDAQGNVADVICYEQDVSVETVNIDQVSSAEAGNKTVLVLDSVDDGLDVKGDVVVSGNNAVVWGEGPDVSVIGGTLDIQKNNAVVRGVRIKGDVAITKNNASFSFCVIEGNLTITGNNATIAECDVLGAIEIAGVNAVLARNHFGSAFEVMGKNLVCNDNFAFHDADEDRSYDEGEHGDPINCEESKDDLAPQSDVELSKGDAGAEEAAGDVDAGVK